MLFSQATALFVILLGAFTSQVAATGVTKTTTVTRTSIDVRTRTLTESTTKTLTDRVTLTFRETSTSTVKTTSTLTVKTTTTSTSEASSTLLVTQTTVITNSASGCATTSTTSAPGSTPTSHSRADCAAPADASCFQLKAVGDSQVSGKYLGLDEDFPIPAFNRTATPFYIDGQGLLWDGWGYAYLGIPRPFKNPYYDSSPDYMTFQPSYLLAPGSTKFQPAACSPYNSLLECTQQTGRGYYNSTAGELYVSDKDFDTSPFWGPADAFFNQQALTLSREQVKCPCTK